MPGVWLPTPATTEREPGLAPVPDPAADPAVPAQPCQPAPGTGAGTACAAATHGGRSRQFSGPLRCGSLAAGHVDPHDALYPRRGRTPDPAQAGAPRSQQGRLAPRPGPGPDPHGKPFRPL